MTDAEKIERLRQAMVHIKHVPSGVYCDGCIEKDEIASEYAKRDTSPSAEKESSVVVRQSDSASAAPHATPVVPEADENRGTCAECGLEKPGLSFRPGTNDWWCFECGHPKSPKTFTADEVLAALRETGLPYNWPTIAAAFYRALGLDAGSKDGTRNE